MTDTQFDVAIREWFLRERPAYERFAESVRATVESLLSQEKIDYLSITSRVKELESFIEKISRKGYTEPQSEMTDIVGLRVITYIETDVERPCEIIEHAFNVYADKSLDKRSELGKDQFGYRSVHFVCDLGEQRLVLPENVAYRDRVFEIQVRTVLQHAWAEIHHDRGYKFTGQLPVDIERRLHAQAAVLEMVDREFDRLANELDQYAREVSDKTRAGDLDVELNTTSLISFLSTRIPRKFDPPDEPTQLDAVLEELRRYGAASLADIDRLLSVLPTGSLKDRGVRTSVGLLREAMMLDDIDKYFEEAYTRRWRGATPQIIHSLTERYGDATVRAVFAKHGIHSPYDEDPPAVTTPPRQSRAAKTSSHSQKETDIK